MADEFTFDEEELSYSEPYPVNIIYLNNTTYEYVRRYTTLYDPIDIDTVAASRAAIIGIQTTPGYYKGLDVIVGIASDITQHVSVHSEPYLFTGITTINNTRLDNAWHFRADPFTGTQGIGISWGVIDEFGFAFSNPDLATNSYGFYYGSPGSPVTTGTWGVFIAPNDDTLSNYFENLVLVGDYTSIGVGGASQPEPILQVLDGTSSRKGLYVENSTGLGIRPNTNYRLYVDDNGCTEAARFDGKTRITDVTDYDGTTASFITDGGAWVKKKLNVDGRTRITDVTDYDGTTASFITDGGAWVKKKLNVGGALTKGSGTFDIEHPKENNKRLRHSFVEAPRYDNIYRNKIRLTNGKAVVNLDSDCVSPGGQTMTPGTWQKLNRNPDIFLQNLEGWSRLKGTILGSILTIECEDINSTDLISWMVIAERQDKHIFDSDISDNEGRLILEYIP